MASDSEHSLFRSAWLVSLGTAVSRLTGLLREQVMAYYFGAGLATDAFVTAFRIPNLLRDLFAEGALSSSFVPVFKDRLVKSTKEDAFRLADNVLTVMIIVLAVVTLLGIAASGLIVYLTAHGFVADKMKFDLTVNLTRIMWPFLILVSVSALFMGILNSLNRFGVPAIAPAMFNIGNIITVVALYAFFDAPIYALTIGVLVGGIGQIAIQLPSLWKIGYRYRPRLSFVDEGLRRMLKLFTPMVIGLSAGRINILVSTLLVSFLVEGSMSYLNYAFRLMHFPLGVFAVAIGTVTLPRVSEMASRGDMDVLGQTFVEALSLNLLLMIPSAFALAILGPDMIALIYQYGRFTAANAENTSLALLHYSYGIIGLGAVRVVAPVYYAMGDARLPMRISIISVVVNMLLYYPLINVMGNDHGFAGVAAATSIAGLLNFGLLLYFLPYKGVKVPYKKLAWKTGLILVAATISMVAAKYLPLEGVVTGDDVTSRIVKSALPLLFGGLMYVALCYVMRIGEIRVLINGLTRRRGASNRG